MRYGSICESLISGYNVYCLLYGLSGAAIAEEVFDFAPKCFSAKYCIFYQNVISYIIVNVKRKDSLT